MIKKGDTVLVEMTVHKVLTYDSGKQTLYVSNDRMGIYVDPDHVHEMKSEGENMKAKKYQMLAERTINNDLTLDQQRMHALHGMVGEIGEIHSIYQKAYQGHEIADHHLKSELGEII